MRYRGSGLDPIATVAGLGATLQASADDAAKQDARSQLSRIGSEPADDAPLAPALSQAALGADTMVRDDLPSAVAFVRTAMELAQRDLASDDPVQVLFAVYYARHLQYADRPAGLVAAERSEKLALETLPQGHPHWINVWYEMAARAMAAGRFDEASSLHARITDLAVREWGRMTRGCIRSCNTVRCSAS